MSTTYSGSTPGLLPVPSSVLSRFSGRWPAASGFPPAARRCVAGPWYGLSAKGFASLFYLGITGCWLLKGFGRACIAGFGNAVRRLFLGLAVFALLRTPRGLGRRLRIFGVGIAGARFAAFALRLFRHADLVVGKIFRFFVGLRFGLFGKVCHRSFTQIIQKFY